MVGCLVRWLVVWSDGWWFGKMVGGLIKCWLGVWSAGWLLCAVYFRQTVTKR